jgi:hypothetical protein
LAHADSVIMQQEFAINHRQPCHIRQKISKNLPTKFHNIQDKFLNFYVQLGHPEKYNFVKFYQKI